MNKSEAIDQLGGTVKGASKLVGVTEAAIRMWPDPLPPRIRDRVQAALWRREQAGEGASDGAQPAEQVSHVG